MIKAGHGFMNPLPYHPKCRPHQLPKSLQASFSLPHASQPLAAGVRRGWASGREFAMSQR